MVRDAQRGAFMAVKHGGFEVLRDRAEAVEFTDFAHGVNPFAAWRGRRCDYCVREGSFVSPIRLHDVPGERAYHDGVRL